MLNPDRNRRGLSRPTIVAVVLLSAAVALPAAAFRPAQGSLPLAGVVYDSTGAVMPGVELTLHDAQDFKWQATTDATGRFEFVPVLPGRYTLQAAVPGFRSIRHEFELREQGDWDRAITMPVGAVTETISVSARRGAGSPVQAVGPQPVRVGGNIKAPTKVRHVNPVYPVSMRDAGREGVVTLEAIIGRDGAVTSLRPLGAQAHPDFVKSAVAAARQWQFTPTLLNGEPVDVAMTVNVTFSLED